MPNWRKNLKQEFGIHFPDDELQFLEAFIEELIEEILNDKPEGYGIMSANQYKNYLKGKYLPK